MDAGTKRWLFVESSPLYTQRDPIQAPFWDTESIRNAANALVREAIQNSLDAGTEDGPVRVRLLVSEGDRALAASSAEPFFDGIWEHIMELCIDEEQVAALELMRSGSCRFLVYEDFNTTGLVGDALTAEEPAPNETNDFFYFWRAEGMSGKGGTDRGRWGLGKYVFPAASRISTVFGFTIRQGESEPLMMGKAILRNHKLGGKSYTPDAWWTDLRNGVPVPVESSVLVREFVKRWGLSRGPGDSGLSLVVPFIDEEVSTTELMRSVIRDYFAAIVMGSLVVEVTSGEPDAVWVVDDATISDHAQLLDDERERFDVLAGIEMVRWGQGVTDVVSFTLPEHDKHGGAWSPGWTQGLLTRDDCDVARSRLSSGEPVCFRVPVLVGPSRQGRKSAEASHFDVILRSEQGNSSAPLFVREGILVSEAQQRAPVGTSLRDYRAIVLADHAPLAKMLGDAEGPAHTTWSDRTPRFKGRYWHGPEWLKFVKQAPWRLLQLIEGSDDDVDRDLAMAVFGIDRPSAGGRVPRPSPDGDVPTPGLQDGTPRPFEVHPVAGGFVLTVTNETECPQYLKIRAAYDVAKGDPFRRWHPADFDFGKSDEAVSLSIEGGSLVRAERNEILIGVEDTSLFRTEVRGLGVTRDVIVDVQDGGPAGAGQS
jgi:hypothetical protein